MTPTQIDQLIPSAWNVHDAARNKAVPDPITGLLRDALWQLEDALDVAHPNPQPFAESVLLALAVVGWCLG
ncbi:hypothetical protein [Gordonia sp. DT101]|uniref:hypothetical protein n=1 Tax=Gordonia sp. DT101 TaxID=3416545 RepID=UPI003CEE0C6A